MELPSKKKKIDGMKSFLYHVLNNLIVDEYRKIKRKTVSLDTLMEAGFTPGIDDTAQLHNISDGATAILLIKKLPLKYQKIIHMRYIDGLSLKEMSIIIGKSENAISVSVHRGVQKLKLLYKI
jgi:RNA polymerase sigma factor (sigma-70 family)